MPFNQILIHDELFIYFKEAFDSIIGELFVESHNRTLELFFICLFILHQPSWLDQVQLRDFSEVHVLDLIEMFRAVHQHKVTLANKKRICFLILWLLKPSTLWT